jgi:hypothetical protein
MAATRHSASNSQEFVQRPILAIRASSSGSERALTSPPRRVDSTKLAMRGSSADFADEDQRDHHQQPHVQAHDRERRIELLQAISERQGGQNASGEEA